MAIYKLENDQSDYAMVLKLLGSGSECQDLEEVALVDRFLSSADRSVWEYSEFGALIR